jgi:hypothetical protein
MLSIACSTSKESNTSNMQVHFNEPEVVSKIQSSHDVVSRRLEQAAIDHREYAPILRAAFPDTSIPPKDEYEQWNGYALLLVTAVSQDSNELPLKRVYVRTSGKDIELKLIKLVWTNQSDLNSQVIKTYGPNRVDSLYLLPIYLLKGKGELLTDFAKNRNEFGLDTFPNTVVHDLDNMPATPPKQEPPPAALKHMIDVSFPGLFKD